ncbi:MAG: hypothetical protein DI582_04435 [Azospirillum brasilense]|nr:MAG: hypothetical protein DI582_04435 [Azospirillum brasilense]
MFTYKHYVPVLKWKLGEYQALDRLADSVKAFTVPLIEIPPRGFDFAKGEQSKTVEKHLGEFGARLKAKWGERRCIIDLDYMGEEKCNDRPCVEAVFADVRSKGCNAIPAIRLATSDVNVKAIADIVKEDREGLCLRLIELDFDRANLFGDIEALLGKTGLGYSEVDLVLDLGFQTYNSNTVATQNILILMNKLHPTLNRWRSIAVVASSFPASIAGLRQEEGKPQFASLARGEWRTYRSLVRELGDARIPTFGDYAAANPELVELDMRLIKPFAKLKYTYDDSWHIAVGKSVRAVGFEQYRGICKELMKQSYFAGKGASDADDFIIECANGTGGTGNLSTWVWVATNRHITKVHSDLASLHGL